ncbi:MAG: GtrA family protein [Bacteroidia bacterium]
MSILLIIETFWKKIIGFSIVGIIVTLFSILLLFLFIQIFKFNLYIGYAISYLISILLSLWLNNSFVFKSGKINFEKIYKYVGVYLISMLIGMLILIPLEFIFPHIGKFWLTLMCVPITYTWNFFFANKILK